jgi:hypothetical protein
MATALPNANINIPYSPFLDDNTGRPSQAWLQWLMNPSVISINTGSAIAVTSGGTGLTTIPTNGQLLIGNGTGYTLNTLGHGAGISVTNGSGTITVANTGVLSFSAGTTGLTPSAATTGAVTLAGTLIAINGGTGFSSYAVGDLLYANTTTTLAKLPDVATGNALISGGVGVAPSWGKIGLTTHVSGILPVANGGTGVATATANTVFAGPTSGADAPPAFRALVAADITGLTYSAPVTKTADFSVAASDLWLINNKSGSTCTVTLPTASAYSGRILHFQNYQSQALVSASSNVVPISGGAAGTSILVASSGDQATLVSDGTNWLMTQYTPNNILLLET